LRVVCISDTHMAEAELPEGDILIHSGDALLSGTAAEWSRFVMWLARVRKQFKHVFYVPGNHDAYVQQCPEICRSDLSFHGVCLLIDQSIEFAEFSIYGSPWVGHINGSWAFEAPKGGSEDFLSRHFSGIRFAANVKTKILVTHSPCHQILDNESRHFGSSVLLTRVLELKPDLHVFGHVHESYGTKVFQGVQFVNASIMSRDYKPLNAPIIVDIGSAEQMETKL
jgi:Icc-related predicted phosphoesterase